MFKYGLDKLTIKTALNIAKGLEKGKITKEALKNINKSNAAVLAIAQGDKVVYGINTGFGPLCNTKIPKKDTSQLQRNLLLSHSVGVGNLVDPFIAKLMLILKVHSLAKGYSGISIKIIERMLWLSLIHI